MRCLLLGLVLVLMLHPRAMAGTRQDVEVLRSAAAHHVAGLVAAAYPDSRAEIEVGPIDPRLNLAYCPEPAFTLSQGGNLWGAGSLAVSCSAPAIWNLYLTYRANLRGPALLARHAMPARHAPQPGDLVEGVVEYGGDPGRYPRDSAGLRGATLTRPVAKGDPITIDMVRVEPIIRSGQRVRIQVDGNGFQISLEGIAQAQAGVGDRLRLKTPSGRQVQGIVQPDGSVRVRP